MSGCCPYGESTLCQHGRCDECAFNATQHDHEAHRDWQRQQAEWEMMHDPSSDLYYSDAAVELRGDGQ